MVYNRYFQVVPVPGVFTRGRWECCDYKEGDNRNDAKSSDILVFDKHTALTSANGLDHATDGNNPATVPLTNLSNVVAIDNKIEQAMDLVKTHLTFAVREEVEQLKSTIADLEGRVNVLESENQLLKQYAPVDVVANLGSIIQTRTNDDPSYS